MKARRERRNRNSAAVQNKGTSLFREVANLANSAVEQFNEGDELRSLTLTQGPTYMLTIQAKGKEGARIQFSLDLEREVITYSYKHLPKASDGEFRLRATDSGELTLHGLSLRHQWEPITRDKAIQKLLEPVFESVK